jgi:hypothetical protein
MKDKKIASKVLCFICGMGAMFIIAYLVGKENLKAQPEPIKTEKVHGDSITVTCPRCGTEIQRELNEANYTIK